MADALWPPSLPQNPRIAELDEAPPDLVLRTEMDAGPAKVRRRRTANVRSFTIALDLTRAQLATFDQFFLETIAGGAEDFEWIHPRTGNGIDCRIVGVPQYRNFKPRQADEAEYYRLTFRMETLPGTEQLGPDDPATEIPDPHPDMFGPVIPSLPDPDDDDAANFVAVIVQPIPREADAAPPVFLLDSLQITIPDGTEAAQDESIIGEIPREGGTSNEVSPNFIDDSVSDGKWESNRGGGVKF